MQDLAGRTAVDQDVEFGLAKQIDETRRDDKIFSIDNELGRRARERTNCNDAVFKNRNVTAEPWSASAINDASVLYKDIETIA